MPVRGPKPWPERRTTTLYLRIPRRDWPYVLTGQKTELRSSGRYAITLVALKTPLPVVGYTMREHQEPAARLLLVEEAWTEPLGAIGPESLEREGFASMAEFRAYWRTYRTRQAFKPLSKVIVCRFRLFRPADREPAALKLFDQLYGHAPT